MSITDLSTELLQKIYDYSELADLSSLARTCRRAYRVYLGRRMHHLQQGLHNSYSPLPSLLKLVISNEPDKSRKPIGTEIRINTILSRIIQVGENPRLTLEHMKKMVEYGKVANRWTELYPRLRWRFGSENRRLLHARERQRLRRALYHHWTYTSLFHSRVFTQYSPDPPSPASLDDPRHRLLRTYSTIEHIQLSEFLAHVEQLVEIDLYPSNSIVQEQYDHSLSPRALANISWGDGSEYRRLVCDIMKLSPADLLHLYEKTTTKTERFDFLQAKEACFGDVPATLNYALSSVSVERARHCWGLEGTPLKVLIPKLQFVSLKAFFPEPGSDFEDDNLVFGILDVRVRGRLGILEDHISCDGVETGEWDKYCRQAGKIPSAVIDTDAED